jgi:aminopeptidase N
MKASALIRQNCGAWLLLVLLTALQTAHAGTADRGFDVQNYAVQLEPNLTEKSVRGHERITLRITQTGIAVLEFDVGALTVDAVRTSSNAMPFHQDKNHQLRIPLAAGHAKSLVLDIDYHGDPRFGLEFHPERHELYTIFSSSQWMVCIDAPDERASLDLSVALPADLKMSAVGRFASRTKMQDGRVWHHWRLGAPMPSYVYGFAAGRYNEASVRAGSTELHFASSDLGAEDLKKVFADTPDMLRFFSDRSGVAYRGAYSQVLVTDTIGQEMAGLSLMDEEFGRDMLADPAHESLIAHELAHQWWGNRVTCRDWNHFWLNEGLATFMAAAYLQHRFGAEVYAQYVERWHQRVEKLHAAGIDRSLVFAEWTKPTSDDRAVVYQKGAYVLHLLREELGDAAFWRGLRTYTRKYDGHSVTTADFRSAMERGSGKDLSTFFAKWVDVPPG